MKGLYGLGKIERERLTRLIRQSRGIILIKDAAEILGIKPSEVAKTLSRWSKKGWVSRISHGVYLPVPIEAQTPDISIEDSWALAERLFFPCYIGGWSAAEYWDLTEQIHKTLVIMTVRKLRKRKVSIRNIDLLLRTVPRKAIFGLKSVWRGQTKVEVSDPTRTILDLMNDPALGGGIRPTAEIFLNYLKSNHKDMALLVNYAEKFGNGAVFKRLGFLIEKLAPHEKETMEACLSRLTQGNAKLDPSIPAGRLITKWKLWVPDNWRQDAPDDK
ncbi:MAG: type IV toxin-antitoxin system AbiEi family antitoxin domain-containing protein [Candidatus Aminicenantales bacterium]